MPSPGSLASANAVVLDPKLARVYMIPINEDGTFNDDFERAFQFWPESLQDSRGDVGWQEKVIPGGSHPLVQWTAGGGRRLSFTVFFSRDKHPDETAAEEAEAEITGEVDEDNISIPAAISWLRYFTYPLYTPDSLVVIPPSPLLLVFPKTETGAAYGAGEVSVDGGRPIDAVSCVMTSCDVTYHSWFPDGSPRVAEASLEFLEIVQSGGKVFFHSRDSLEIAFDMYLLRKQDK